MIGRILPDQTAFDEPVMVLKKKKDTPLSNVATKTIGTDRDKFNHDGGVLGEMHHLSSAVNNNNNNINNYDHISNGNMNTMMMTIPMKPIGTFGQNQNSLNQLDNNNNNGDDTDDEGTGTQPLEDSQQNKNNNDENVPPAGLQHQYTQQISITPSKSMQCPKAPTKTPLRSPANKAEKYDFTINSNGDTVNPVHFLTQRKRTKSSSSHFVYIQKLGEGCFGEVWKAKSLIDDCMYAIKKSKRPIWETKTRNEQLQEIEKGMVLGHHPNISIIKAAWEEGAHLYIQQELCEKGSLKDELNRRVDKAIDEETLWRYIADIARGLEHIHNHNIIHLDIKPENLLFSNDDFGVSTTNGDTEGDKVYMALELLDDQVSTAADVFSFGITILEAATNYDLPQGGQWWRNLREGQVPFPDDCEVSPTLRNLIVSMMETNPASRITIKQILELDKVKEIVEAKKKIEQPRRLQRKLF
ncbi:putative protein tyrosine kinase [Cavenderia fasciculata]|uniref:Protein kinase domain-containing protein n=1 Tax=Cavenderia fasciculata TaxID=261658 RepID=F4PW27_CACFS|nr:putative protein tyrosine kinase [Cavenderia fasciculata]EGG20191.1 putative protein tyrosine kinase [Cavenderia fasciculata]|eukprot:XP_004367174.1 putative protein tyrosine kinase [Cavenderia fasciculata]